MAFSMSFLLVAALACSAAVALPAEPQIRFTTPAPSDLDPNHVPSSVCASMLPDHGPNKPRNSDAPYLISVSSRAVKKGETVKVTVRGLASETFKGLYIQGRINDKPVGRWLKPANQPQVHVSDCPPGKENALSYVSRTTALDSLVLDWVAPSDVTGDLVFQATIVKSYAQFWTNVRSTPLKVVPESPSKA